MLKGAKKYYAIITWIRKAVDVYFGQFLVFYFFTVANYDILPISLYYVFELAFLGVGFFLIRHSMKSNNRVSYYRIGLALQAFYLSLVMLLKENIIHFAPLVGMIYGLGEGFYHFPNNIMYSNIVEDQERKKFEGYLNLGSNALAIIIPFLVGYFLTYFDYVSIAKVVFCLMIFAFFLSFGFHDEVYVPKKSNVKGFLKLIQNNTWLKKRYLATFLAGFTFSSGSLSLVVTIYTIFEFETSLNLGIITSVFAILTCLCSYYFASRMKENHFSFYVIVCTIFYASSIFLFGFIPSKLTILFYNFTNAIFLHILSLIFSVVVNRGANQKDIKDEFQTEYFLLSDLVYSFSRVPSYLFVLFLTMLFGISSLKYSFYLFSVFIFFFGFVLNQMLLKK